MGSATRNLRNEHQKNIVRIFEGLCARHNRWQTWADFITLSAIAISNCVDQLNAPERMETYRHQMAKYSEKEQLALSEMLNEVVMGMEQNPNQDFLGELYMCLDFGNEHCGQFFTPYCVCEAMNKITEPDIRGKVEKQGWVSVLDPACGAGALLVAFANECLVQGVNFQTSVLFVAQDIDFVVGCMCYLQLSLLGCAGYVVIDDSLLHPTTSADKRGLIPHHSNRIWYTPMYFRDEWHWRRVWAQMDMMFSAVPQAAELMKATKPKLQQPELTITKAGQLSLF